MGQTEWLIELSELLKNQNDCWRAREPRKSQLTNIIAELFNSKIDYCRVTTIRESLNY